MPAGSIRSILAILASAAAVTLGVGSPGAASASVGRPAVYRATPECLVLPNCLSLYQFSPASSAPLVVEATGALSNAPVILDVTDATDISQDWTYIDLGTVGSYQNEGFGNTFGLDGFDVASYRDDELYQLEFSPAGIPSGFCAANVASRMVLRICNGSRFQTMISTDDILSSRTSPLGYFYGLSAAPAPVPAGHLAITGSGRQGAQITFSRPVISNSQFWQPS